MTQLQGKVAFVTGASGGIGAAVARTLSNEDGYGRPPEALAGTMSADDVAAVVVFCLTRPRAHRILETALRPMTEPSWG